MEKYSGYLKPYEEQIRSASASGMSTMRIAEMLIEQGVKSPQLGEETTAANLNGLIRNILKLNKKQLPSVEKLEKRVAWAREQLYAAEKALAEARKRERDR